MTAFDDPCDVKQGAEISSRAKLRPLYKDRMQKSRPQLGQRLSKVLGTPFANGNLVFQGADTLLSVVGNRCSIFDLVQQSTTTLPFETRKNIRRMAVSYNGRFLVLIDVEGHALFVNLPRRVVLHRFHFKR